MVAGNNSYFGVQFIPERGCENEYPVKQLESEKKLDFTTVSRKSGCDKGLYLKKTCVLEILKRI
jgi:hypothetical protein